MILSNPKIIPFLWFDNNATDAVKFYTSIFAIRHLK
ncbi:MAG: VOC family protein [Brevinematales bacterium]